MVWWDPNALSLNRDDQVGLRQQEILKIDESGANSDASIRAHDHWQQRRRETTRQGARPTLVAHTVTEHTQDHPTAPGASGEPAPVLIERVTAGRTARPHGKRFGTLVHAVIAEIALDAPADAIGASAAVQGRYLGCSPAEVEAAARTVAEALRHPLLRRAAAAQSAGRCRRELPLSLRLPDGTVLDGVVDLAFTEIRTGPGSWSTSRPTSASPATPPRTRTRSASTPAPSPKPPPAPPSPSCCSSERLSKKPSGLRCRERSPSPRGSGEREGRGAAAGSLSIAPLPYPLPAAAGRGRTIAETTAFNPRRHPRAAERACPLRSSGA